jgi:hypothetical protein
MKKLIVILIILILSKYNAISQNLDSLTAIPNSKLRIAINVIERGKVTEEELIDTKQKVAYLQNRIIIKDSLLLRYGQKDQYWRKVDSTNNKKIFHLNQYVQNSQRIYDIQIKQLKSQKIQKWVYLVVGAASTYLIIKH